MSPAKQRGKYTDDWAEVAQAVKDAAGWCCIRCGAGHNPMIGRTLTVHHFDGNKSNNARWNLMALCQACHLRIQAKVDPQIPLLMTPSDWILPYLAGFYESGAGIPGPGYSLAYYISIYAPDWPEWAPQLGREAE